MTSDYLTIYLRNPDGSYATGLISIYQGIQPTNSIFPKPIFEETTNAIWFAGGSNVEEHFTVRVRRGAYDPQTQTYEYDNWQGTKGGQILNFYIYPPIYIEPEPTTPRAPPPSPVSPPTHLPEEIGGAPIEKPLTPVYMMYRLANEEARRVFRSLRDSVFSREMHKRLHPLI